MPCVVYAVLAVGSVSIPLFPIFIAGVSAAGALGLAYGGKWVYDTVTKAQEFFQVSRATQLQLVASVRNSCAGSAVLDSTAAVSSDLFVTPFTVSHAERRCQLQTHAYHMS
jgi:hypothetical protein